MINLETFFRNHFNAEGIDDEHLMYFTKDHVQRLFAANPEGQFDDMLRETRAAFEMYFGVPIEEMEELPHSWSLIQDKLIRDFKSAVKRKEPNVRQLFHQDTKMYAHFFPNGLEEYLISTDDEAMVLMKRMMDASLTHVAELGIPMMNLFRGFYREYSVQRNGIDFELNEGSRGDSEKRDDLEFQLMYNLLEIAAMNIGNPDQIEVYFDQNYFKGMNGQSKGGN